MSESFFASFIFVLSAIFSVAGIFFFIEGLITRYRVLKSRKEDGRSS